MYAPVLRQATLQVIGFWPIRAPVCTD